MSLFKDMKLGTKISFGFGLLITIAIILGGISVYYMNVSGTSAEMLDNEYVPEVRIATDLRGAANRLMLEMRGYGLTGETRFYTEAQKELVEIDKNIKLGDELDKKSKNLKALKGQLENARKATEEYKGLIDETATINKELDAENSHMDKSAGTFMSSLADLLEAQNDQMREEISESTSKEKLDERLVKITLVNDVIDLGNAARVSNFKSQASRDPKVMNAGLENFSKMYSKIESLKKITRRAEDINDLKLAENSAQTYEESMREYLKLWLQREELATKREAAGDALIAACITTADAGLESTEKIAEDTNSMLSKSSNIMIFGLIIAFIVGVAVAYIIISSITKPINKIVTDLKSSSHQVSSASEQLSQASQELAEGSSEQAASIEETSSTLDETSSMVQQNTDNTKQAAILSQDARDAAGRGNSEMNEMMTAMNEIKNSSDEIAKIIKVIDDIAFQTNILALNAAVEAARAGDAGMGFAVVAEEVRNLAQRSAQAAKDTADMIETSIKRSENGVSIARKVATALSEITEKAQKVNEIMDEITTASQEQSQGVFQINKAVNQIEQVTQNIASNAEESASASEELSAQAENMMVVVENLTKLVNGAKATLDDISTDRSNYSRQVREVNNKTFAKRSVSKITSPEDVIPLEDDTLDF